VTTQETKCCNKTLCRCPEHDDDSGDDLDHCCAHDGCGYVETTTCSVCEGEITTAWVTSTTPWIAPFKHADIEECKANLKVKRQLMVAERVKRHTDRGGCPAIIRHGPGRQSDTFCQKPLGHEGEHEVVVEVWTWKGDEAMVDDWGDVYERQD
jgi:hypothetical protein